MNLYETLAYRVSRSGQGWPEGLRRCKCQGLTLGRFSPS